MLRKNLLVCSQVEQPIVDNFRNCSSFLCGANFMCGGKTGGKFLDIENRVNLPIV